MIPKIIIITNSAYSYLWPILNDTLIDLDNVVVCCDTDIEGFKFDDGIKVFYYDKNLIYTKRMAQILNSVKEDYVFICHDVDIMINFNKEKFKKYCNVVYENSIDRLSFAAFNNPNDIIKKDDTVFCRLKPGISRNFFTPFDHSPSLYKKSSILPLYEQIDSNYAPFERINSVQTHFNNLKSYGIQKSDFIKLRYHRGFVYTEDFDILHLTVQGKFLPNELYYDLIDTLLDLKNRYDLSCVTTHENHAHISKNEI